MTTYSSLFFESLCCSSFCEPFPLNTPEILMVSPHLAWVHPWLWQRKRVERKSTRPWERQTNRQTQTDTQTDNNCSHFEVSTPHVCVLCSLTRKIFFGALQSVYDKFRILSSTSAQNFSCFLKGTQDWEFFWLRFWNLRYFFVSYA